MKEFVLVVIILLLVWNITRGQKFVIRRSWKRVKYHWEQTLHHFAEVSILVGTLFLGLLVLFVLFYLLYL